jgi:hypothetical protein
MFYVTLQVTKSACEFRILTYDFVKNKYQNTHINYLIFLIKFHSLEIKHSFLVPSMVNVIM